jgi:hypothetical protein
MLVQAFLPQATVEALKHGIVGGRTLARQVQFHPGFVCLSVHCLLCELTAVVNFDCRRITAMSD